MSDDEALLRAICESPEEDIPRLMYADFLDETGEAERAAFIRAQVDAARQPPWEPFPVFCRHRKPEWTTGRPWTSTLPDFPLGWNIEWGDPPFRRGFGWRVTVRWLSSWHEVAPKLFETNPVGELHLNPAATLDDWRKFASSDWVRKLRVLKLDGANLSEPLRALRESDVPTSIEDVHLLRASSPGLSFIVSELLQSRLGETIRGLHLRTGDGALDNLREILSAFGGRLERLSLVNMGLNEDFLVEFTLRNSWRNLTELNLSGNPVGDDVLRLLAGANLFLGGTEPRPPLPLRALSLAETRLTLDGLGVITEASAIPHIRSLDLSHNPLRPRAMKALAETRLFVLIRSLNLSRCNISEKGIKHLIRAKFWPNLVELDLRDNPIANLGARHLLDAAIPRDLTALLIDGGDMGVETRNELRRKFGDAVIFAPPA